jgi:putative transposase
VSPISIRRSLLTPNVNGDLQPVRVVPPNGRSVTAYYTSRQGVLLQAESHLELHAIRLLDYEPAVKNLATQPIIAGLGRVPDIRAETRGPPSIIDVKYEIELVKKWTDLAPILSDTFNYCNANGLDYLIFTDHSRNEQRNRVDVLTELSYRALASSPNSEMENTVLSIMKSGVTLSIRALAKKLDAGTDHAKKRDVICKLVHDGSLTIISTPTSIIDDATLSITKENAPLPTYLMSFARLVKRIETHPLRYMNGQEVDFYNGKKEIELAGHKYAIVDGTCPENLLIRSIESGEEYRVSLDTYDVPGGRLSAYLLQQDPERYSEYIRRIEIISALAHFRRIPSESLAEATRLLGLGKRQLDRLLGNYRKYGSSGLLPSLKRGGKGKHRLKSKKLEEIISETIDKYYLTEQDPKVAATYRRLLSAIDKANKILPDEQRLKFPDYKTLQNRINEVDPRTKALKRKGSLAADNRFGIFGNKFDESKFPLHTVMVDHGKMDIILVDGKLREPVGRPFLTGMIDTYSRCLPAFYVALKQPTANEVGITILKCVLSKDSEVIKYGITEWPIRGVPSGLHFDNAKEFRSNLILAGCAAWGITKLHRPVMNPRFGGFVERLIETFQEEIHTLPGTTKSNPKERGIYDSENEACLTIDELESLLVHFIDKYHHTPQKELDGMTPLEKFRKGVAEHGVPRQIAQEDEERFRISFLPAALRIIQKGGIEFEGLKFYSPRLSASSLPREDNAGDSIYYPIRFDPFDLRYIWILDAKMNSYVRIPSNTPFPEPILLRKLQIARTKLERRGMRRPSPSIVFEEYKDSIIGQAVLSTRRARREAEIERRETELGKRFSVAPTQGAEPLSGIEQEFDSSSIDLSKIRVYFKRPGGHP